jgi:hypothetical protein
MFTGADMSRRSYKNALIHREVDTQLVEMTTQCLSTGGLEGTETHPRVNLLRTYPATLASASTVRKAIKNTTPIQKRHSQEAIYMAC